MSLILNPYLHKHYGTQNLLRTGTVGSLVRFPLGPLTYIARNDTNMAVVGMILALEVATVYTQSLSYCELQDVVAVFLADKTEINSALAIAVVEVSPTPETLGQVISFFLINTIFVRRISPAAATSVYAFGVESNLVSGQFAGLVRAFFAVGLCDYTFTRDLYKAEKPASLQSETSSRISGEDA